MLKCHFEKGCTKDATCVDMSGQWMCREHVATQKIFYEVKKNNEDGFEVFRVIKHSAEPVNDFSSQEKAEACAYQAMLRDKGSNLLLRQEQELPIIAS